MKPRVELEPEPELKAEIRNKPDAPVVPPLNTAFAPRRSRLKDDGKAAAEEAILAAVAATGDDVRSVEPQMADESPYRRLRVKPQRSGGLRQP